MNVRQHGSSVAFWVARCQRQSCPPPLHPGSVPLHHLSACPAPYHAHCDPVHASIPTICCKPTIYNHHGLRLGGKPVHTLCIDTRDANRRTTLNAHVRRISLAAPKTREGCPVKIQPFTKFHASRLDVIATVPHIQGKGAMLRRTSCMEGGTSREPTRMSLSDFIEVLAAWT